MTLRQQDPKFEGWAYVVLSTWAGVSIGIGASALFLALGFEEDGSEAEQNSRERNPRD